MDKPLHVVTGAFGYSGRWVAHHLLKSDARVRTLTNAVGRDDPFDGRVEVHGLDFNDTERLVESLRGAEVLYNTYWVRYNKREHRFAHNTAAVENTSLFEAARLAGVKTRGAVLGRQPDQGTELDVLRLGQGQGGNDAQRIGPLLLHPKADRLFGGHQNVLINNIAWMLRRFPVFGVFGFGNYPDPTRPGRRRGGHRPRAPYRRTPWWFYVGPETFRYKDYIRHMVNAMGLLGMVDYPATAWSVAVWTGARRVPSGRRHHACGNQGVATGSDGILGAAQRDAPLLGVDRRTRCVVWKSGIKTISKSVQVQAALIKAREHRV